MLILDKRRAMEAMVMRNYRVAFRKSDDLGVVEYVCDVKASTLARALDAAGRLKARAHPDDHALFRCVRAVEVERTTAVEGAPA